MKYTPEQTQVLVDQYNKGVGVIELSQIMGVPARSVIAKLSSLGVYQKKGYLSKTGEVPVTKEQLLDQIAVLLNTNTEVLESLTKCNKSVLKILVNHLKK